METIKTKKVSKVFCFARESDKKGYFCKKKELCLHNTNLLF